MSGRPWSFRWTWVINVYALFFLAFGAPVYISMLIDDVFCASRIGDYFMIGCGVAALGLWLYSRCRGAWRTLEPPPGVPLFRASFYVLTLVVSLFVR